MRFTVEYDTTRHTIRVPVFAAPSEDPSGNPKISTPPVAIPKGIWHVTWHLDPNSPVLVALTDPGVTKQNPEDLPPLTLTGIVISPENGALSVTANNDADGPNACNVNLHFQLPSQAEVSLQQGFTHDPTIAVTQDPLDPPT